MLPSGHVHLWEQVSFASDHPAQFVSGFAGTAEDTVPLPASAPPAPGAVVETMRSWLDGFCFMTMERTGADRRTVTVDDRDERPHDVCSVQGRHAPRSAGCSGSRNRIECRQCRRNHRVRRTPSCLAPAPIRIHLLRKAKCDMKKILEATSPADLEKIGTVETLVREIDDAIAPLKIAATSYPELFNAVSLLKENWLPFSTKPFANRRQQVIYYLLDHEGQKQQELLGVTDEMLGNAKLAKAWYKQLAQIVRADINTDERTKQAFQSLQGLYADMTDDADFRGEA